MPVFHVDDMFCKVSTKDQIETVESLAKEIWTEHYVPIIGEEQVVYMLENFQSTRAISEHLGSGFLYFLVKEKNQYVGYIAVLPKGDELFLSKIYVRSSKRGKGYGRKAMLFIENLARERKLGKITLTVNKANRDAIKAYEKLGFTNLGPVVQDIGGGFIMDDYAMEKTVRLGRCKTG